MRPGFIVSLPLRFWILTATVTAVSLGLRFSSDTESHFFVDVGAISAYLSAVGALYSILAAFTVYVVWNQFNELDEAIEAEVEDLFDLYRYTVYLRDDQAVAEVGKAIQRYCQYVVEQEWQGMATGKIHELSTATFEDIFAVVHSVRFDDERDIAAWSEMIRKFEAVSDARRKRLRVGAARVPDLLRALLYLVSGGLIVGFFMLAIENTLLSIGVTAIVSAIVFLTIEVVEDLDDPFGGHWALSPRAFDLLPIAIEAIQARQ